MEDKSAEMPQHNDANISLQNHPYPPPDNQQYPPQQPPPMHVPQMQYTPSNGNPQYLGPPPQSSPCAAQQPGMQKAAYPPTSAAYPPDSAGSTPLLQQGYVYPEHILQQNMTSNTIAVVAGDQIPVAQVTQEIPPNYAALSRFVCLCCCWPFGIAAIMTSSMVDFAVANGNITEAYTLSVRTKTLIIVGTIWGIIIITSLINKLTLLS